MNNVPAILVVVAGVLLAFVVPPSACIVVFNPNNPAASGYQLVFDSEFNDLNDISNTCTNPTNHSDGGCNGGETNWYPSNWSFPGTTTDVTNDGVDISIEAPPFPSHKTTVLHMHPATTFPAGTGGWALSTMGVFGGASHGPANWQQGWHGHVFTGGWYVEARVSTEYPGLVLPHFVNGHVTIWSYAIDRKITTAPEWAEDDFLDGLDSDHEYLMGILDWNASNNVDVTTSNGCIEGASHNININCGGLPSNFQDRTHAHIYGQLWVPATGSTQGFTQNYFDGVAMGGHTWNQCSGGAGTCARDGSVLDFSHMQVNFGNDHGDGTSSWWDWVHIWQLPSAMAASGNVAIVPQPHFTGSTYP